MRVAVIFFGLARGVAMTIESIKSNIFACNPADFYTIASLNMVARIRNPRNGENGISPHAAEVFLLNADAYALLRQDDAAIGEAFAAARTQHDPFQNNWISIRNVLHQLASLRRAWALSMDALHGDVDCFLFVRPDLIYHDEINLADILQGFEGRGNIAVPAWHSFGGFNDRFAVADATAARAYAERLTLVPEFCATAAFHPETFLAYVLEKAECRVCRLPVWASRVRAHGAIMQEDFGESITSIPLTPTRFFLRPGQVVFHEDQLAADSDYGTSPEMIGFESDTIYVPDVLPPRKLRRTIVDGHRRVSPLYGLPYLEFLAALHRRRQVNRYLEIGTQSGMSLRLARGQAVAIDPKFVFEPSWPEKPGIHLFEMTSDAFFAAHDPREILGGPVELAFIDGMHLAEFVLRDFIHVERYCSKDSLIVLHDAIPMNFEMTERECRTSARRDKAMAWNWTGDVWRVLPLLRRERPALRIEILDCPPTGLVLIGNLDPQYRMQPGRLDELTRMLAETDAPESEFWPFIESLDVADSRKIL